MFWESHNEMCQLQDYWGKGPRVDYGTKGKGYVKGNKGSGKKGVGKGSDKDKGKGKGWGFQGYCHWCGEWGHSQSRCKVKDEYMDGLCKSKGFEKGGIGWPIPWRTRHLAPPSRDWRPWRAQGGGRCVPWKGTASDL